VTAFVRRANDGSQIVVVQNWTDKEVSFDLSLEVPPEKIPDYLSYARVDRSVKGALHSVPLISRRAEKKGPSAFTLGAYGFAVYPVESKGGSR
jgi:hypothetical protein